VLELIVVLIDLNFILMIEFFYNNFQYVFSKLELIAASFVESSFFSRTNNISSLHFGVISFYLLRHIVIFLRNMPFICHI
jgi:choline kinase